METWHERIGMGIIIRSYLSNLSSLSTRTLPTPFDLPFPSCLLFLLVFFLYALTRNAN